MLRAILLASVVVALCAFALAANPIPITPWGDLDIFGDTAAMDELVWDTSPSGIVTVYVVQMFGPPGGTAGVHFKAPRPACFEAVWLFDELVFPVSIGDSQTGIGIGYGSCRSYPVHVLTIHYFGQGLSTCCYYWVQADDRLPSGRIEAADCNFDVVYLSGGATIINQDRCVTPVEETTWGEVKSLYVE